MEEAGIPSHADMWTGAETEWTRMILRYFEVYSRLSCNELIICQHHEIFENAHVFEDSVRTGFFHPGMEDAFGN